MSCYGLVEIVQYLFVKSRLLLEQLARHDTENMFFGPVIVDDAAFVANLQTERATVSMFLNSSLTSGETEL